VNRSINFQLQLLGNVGAQGDSAFNRNDLLFFNKSLATISQNSPINAICVADVVEDFRNFLLKAVCQRCQAPDLCRKRCVVAQDRKGKQIRRLFIGLFCGEVLICDAIKATAQQSQFPSNRSLGFKQFTEAVTLGDDFRRVLLRIKQAEQSQELVFATLGGNRA